MSAFDLRPCSMEVVEVLCREHHGYAGAGGAAVYAFAVYEAGRAVAAYAWQPPPFGAAKSVCPEQPQGVLALSRMVAVPREERALKHVSKPLRVQMKRLIDRTRWPVLLTYHDEGEGHTGYVYACSGWQRTGSKRAPVFMDETGRRTSRYSNGKTGGRELVRNGSTTIHRWEHWVCERGAAARWMAAHGWRRVALPGKTWASGRPAHKFVREEA